MSEWLFFAIVIGFYPAIVLVIAMTGPHSRFEKEQMMRERIEEALNPSARSE